MFSIEVIYEKISDVAEDDALNLSNMRYFWLFSLIFSLATLNTYIRSKIYLGICKSFNHLGCILEMYIIWKHKE